MRTGSTIRRWWSEVGDPRYPAAKRLVITADGGGSNGSRVRLWKIELQTLANELGIEVIVERIGATTTKTGLTVRCELDEAK